MASSVIIALGLAWREAIAVIDWLYGRMASTVVKICLSNIWKSMQQLVPHTVCGIP
jgi:hypothetical protein